MVDFSLGRLPDALQEFDAALRLDPGHFDAHNNRAAALFRSGRVEEAIREFEAALRINPDSAGVRKNLELVRGQR